MTTSGPHAFFIDTNILIYAYDAADVEKRARAIDVLSRLALADSGVLSVQILGEFYNTITRKPTVPLTPAEAEAAVWRYLSSWPVLGISSAIVREAVRLARERQTSYWDGLILATAKLNSVPNLLTEDLQDGQFIEGVRIINPLKLAFDLATLA